PLIVRWKGRVEVGRVDERTVLSAVDVVPSLARLAGATLDPAHALDGEEMSGAFFGEAVRRENPLFWYFINNPWPARRHYLSPNYTVREGKWQLLVDGDGGGAELYDLAADPFETTDVAAANPDVTARLTATVLAWRETLPPESR